MVSDPIQLYLASLISHLTGYDPISRILGPIKSDLLSMISDPVGSDPIYDIRSDQIGFGPSGGRGDRAVIPSVSPSASLDCDPGLAAASGLGDGIGGRPRPRGGFRLPSPRRRIAPHDPRGRGARCLVPGGASPRERSPPACGRSARFGRGARAESRGGRSPPSTFRLRAGSRSPPVAPRVRGRDRDRPPAPRRAA